MLSPTPLILCVDDEIVGLEVRKLLLEDAGYRVLTALDGTSGLEMFQQTPVQAVILDYNMPDISGGEVASRMRQAKPEIPIVLLTACTTLPPQVLKTVDVFVGKGEGAPVLLDRLGELMAASQRSFDLFQTTKPGSRCASSGHTAIDQTHLTTL